MGEFIDINEENGELIMQNMENALAFQGWDLLGAKYDRRFKNIRALFSHGEDTDVHLLSLKMDRAGKLVAYNELHFPPELFIRYFDHKKNGFVLTAREERLKKVFERAMTPELALKLVEAGICFEKAGHDATDGNR